MRVKIKLEIAPRKGIADMCEAAGLAAKEPKRWGKGMRYQWSTDGPATTARFASLGGTHRLALGGAKLTVPPKGTIEKVSTVVTLLAPPLDSDERRHEGCHTASRDVHFPYSPSPKAHVGSTLGRHGARFPCSRWPRGLRRARWPGPLFLRCMILPAIASRTPALRPPAVLAVVCLAAHIAAVQPLARAPCMQLSNSCVSTRKVCTHSCERAQIGEPHLHRSRSGT